MNHLFPKIRVKLCSVTLFLTLLVVICPPSTSVSKYPLLIVVSFDGFRWDYLNKTDTPNFDKIIANGVKAPCIEARFITKTFPNHHSIATGLYEETHGIVANSFYDPVLNDVFSLSDTGPEWWDTGAVPVWVGNQLSDSDRFSGGMMWPGTNAWIKNQTAFHVRNYDDTLPWNTRVDEVIQWLLDVDTPANCVYMYFENPDSAAHEFGPNSPQVVLEIQRADSIIGYLVASLKAAGLYDQINIIITSDHGMAEVPAENTIDLTTLVDTSLFQSYGSSPVWSILPNEGLDDVVYESLKNASLNLSFEVYKKEDIPEVYHYQNNRRIMPILVVSNDHWDILPYTPYPPTQPVTGNHGYNNSLTDMHPFFMAIGPDFKSNYLSTPFRNIDIYPLVCCLIGIQPMPNNEIGRAHV